MSSSTGSVPAHRSVANIRPTPSVTAAAPNSPHTPLRTISSTFGSPSALRAEEDCVVLELGARYLRAGFAGDAAPKAVLKFGPEEQRRAGDYRRWEVEYETVRRGHTAQKSWGETHELWRPDLRGLDLGLVGDKIERALREAYSNCLLIDSRPRRMFLTLPSALPLPLVSVILDTLFSNFQPPNVSLTCAPMLTTAAAGLRSALVVDIGWAETVVTAIYEYREVQCRRSVRAMKILGEAFFKMIAEGLGLDESTADPGKPKSQKEMAALPSFEECEDILARMAWCKPGLKRPSIERRRELTPVNEEDELRASMRSLNVNTESGPNSRVSIPLSSTSPARILEVPFSDLSEPCEKALFGKGQNPQEMDDEELPLHILIYRSLLQLPVDVRSLCMSRIIFVGGGSRIPGLKSRILDDIANLIDERGWDPVSGKSYEGRRLNPTTRRTTNKPGPIEVPLRSGDFSASSNAPAIAAAFAEQESDPIEDQLKREASKRNKPTESGNLRIVNSLGAWAGGSLLSQLKIPAVSVVDREQWLQHGASGASRGGEIVTGSRQSMGPTAFKAGAAERSSWTLGLWA